MDILLMIKDALLALLVSPLIIAIFSLMTAIILGSMYYDHLQHKKVKQRMNEIIEKRAFFTPTEIKTIRSNLETKHIPGVYLLHNKSKDKYFVGNGRKVLDGVSNHFSGRGNKEVYADYKSGDDFSIKIVGLINSGYETMELLEKEIAEKYPLDGKGYI